MILFQQALLSLNLFNIAFDRLELFREKDRIPNLDLEYFMLGSFDLIFHL